MEKAILRREDRGFALGQTFSSFLSVGHWPSLLASFLHFDVSFMVWVLMGALGNYIAEDFGLSATQKGFMTALPILSGSLFRIVIGALADRYGPHRVGTVSILLTLAPLVWGWLGATGYLQLLSLGLLLGVAGASFAVALPLASRWYPPRHQGLIMGITGAGNSGTTLAALLAPRLAEVVGWHGVFGLMTVPVLAVAALFAFAAKEAPYKAGEASLTRSLDLTKEADVWWFCMLYSVTFGGFVGLSSFLSIFFHDQYAMDKVQSGTITALCVFGGSLVRPLGGYLADRRGGVFMLSLLFPLVGLVMLGVSQLPPLLIVTPLIVLGMGALGMGNGAVFQLVPQRFGSRIATATGIVGAAGGVGGFCLPFALGLLRDTLGSYGAGFTLFAALCFSAFLFLLALRQGWSLTWLAPPRTGHMNVAVPEHFTESKEEL
ncbi:MAG: transporter [Dehalococcoidia bacterium]|nr:transporter [Dehalococcoidia bacterium]